MLTLGSSKKRGTKQRGFRGVGRLSGLGYCKELIFENSVKGKSYKLIWDCVKLKKILRNLDDKVDLKKIILDSTYYKEEKSEQTRNSFRVHLNGLIRVNSDVLISESRIKSYLSCVAPVPFSPKFKFSEKIKEILSGVNLANVEIYCNDNETPIYRPHRNKFQISESIEDEFIEVEKIEIESIDNSQAAVGWVMDHNYKGAIPPSALIKGIRIRAGNIQVGDENILQEIFKEKRFNSWCVGEIHILDNRIMANGRRDNFENNNHYENLKNKLNPTAFHISKRCRILSSQRNWKKKCDTLETNIKNKLEILDLNATSKEYNEDLLSEVKSDILYLDSIGGKTLLDAYDTDDIIAKVKEFEKKVKNLDKLIKKKE